MPVVAPDFRWICMLAEPAGAIPSTVSLIQLVVPAASDAELVPPSHLSLMSNQLTAICVVPVAALPLAHTSPCHFWPACTGWIGATRKDGEPAEVLPVLARLTDHLPVCAAEVVLTSSPNSGMNGRHGVSPAALSKPLSVTVAGSAVPVNSALTTAAAAFATPFVRYRP